MKMMRAADDLAEEDQQQSLVQLLMGLGMGLQVQQQQQQQHSGNQLHQQSLPSRW
jgi:hypothetical protein